ncbi:MAG: DUF2911 domain-containing protein [Gemmatimonadota bacterium]|jgi:hypothetical protein
MIGRFVSVALLVAGAAPLLGALPAAAQDLHPSRRLSPVGIAKTFLGDTYVKVTYGRPYVRDRAIFGDPADGETYLVPFGQLWRTGANEATEITLTGPVEVAGRRLDAGTYSAFTVPGAERWEVRFHPGLGMDGTGRLGAAGTFTETYDPALDVLTVELPTGTLDESVDPFTISFAESTAGVDMVLAWETTEVRVPLAPAGG